MENKSKKNNLAKGIIAAGGVLTAAALRELVLSKEEHDKKEKEIKKLEKEKDKYVKQIGEYEAFDVDGKGAKPGDSKLVNLLTRAVGVAFANDDVFTRNKSNVRTFPFIISNNPSINAQIEVELRKYQELLVASQVANLINHTVFAAENILNIKDDGRRSVDKVVDRILDRKMDVADLGNSLQRGLYENVVFEKDGDIYSLNESYENLYSRFYDMINDYETMAKGLPNTHKGKQSILNDIKNLDGLRTKLLVYKKRLVIDFTLAPGAPLLTRDETDAEKFVKDLFNGKFTRPFDDVEDRHAVVEIDGIIPILNNAIPKYAHGKQTHDNVVNYRNALEEYHKLLDKGISVLSFGNNNARPSNELMDSDPYYRLLDLNRVEDYSKSSQLLMNMFNRSNTLKVKLEMAAALLISTEIVPFEFIEYATKYLGLPMTDNTKIAIGLKYGTGTADNPIRFMGNNYTLSDRDQVLKFYSAMRPNEIANLDELARKLTKKQLKANRIGFFDFLRSRTALEQKWKNKHKLPIDKQLASLYDASRHIDDRKKINKIDKEITRNSNLLGSTRNNLIDSVVKAKSDGSVDFMFGKSLSLLGAGGARVDRIIEDRLRNKIVDLYSVKDVDKSLDYFINGPRDSDKGFKPTDVFLPNLHQTHKLIQSIMSEGLTEIAEPTILTEELIMELTENAIEESYVYNMTMPTRSVTYKEVNKDPIEYILPAYTKGRALLYGNAEIDQDQFKTRKAGEPIWIKVTFSDKINSMKADMTDNDFTTVIGIKSEVYRVQEKEIAKVLKNPTANIPDLVEIFKKQRNQTLGLLTKIANENDLKSANLNGVLVVSMNEATSNIATKPSEDYINNPKLAVQLKKTYNLTTICLVDAIAEEYYILEENSTSWSRMPFAELKGAGGNNSDLKALASLMGRR